MEIINADGEFFEREDEFKKIYTATALTINYAKNKIFESVENNIDSDLYNRITQTDKKKEAAL